MRLPFLILFILFVVLCCGIPGCGSSSQITSRWRDREITIDGLNTEWHDSLTALDDKGTSVGVFNDSEYVYIGIVTTREDLRNQIMRGGLTLWFDRDGNSDKKFGIHYPLGFIGRNDEPPGGRGGEASGEGDRDSLGEGLGNARRSPMEASNDLEILGPKDEDRHRMTIAEAGGIDARFHVSHDSLVYEMKVPLDNGVHPFGIGTKYGALIGIGAETSAGRGGARSRR